MSQAHSEANPAGSEFHIALADENNHRPSGREMEIMRELDAHDATTTVFYSARKGEIFMSVRESVPVGLLSLATDEFDLEPRDQLTSGEEVTMVYKFHHSL